MLRIFDEGLHLVPQKLAFSGIAGGKYYKVGWEENGLITVNPVTFEKSDTFLVSKASRMNLRSIKMDFLWSEYFQ